MKVVLAILAAVAVAFLFTTTWVGAQTASERPPGVDAESWVALSQSAGIVLTDVMAAPPQAVYRFQSNGAVAIPQLQRATGVLMAKINGVWARVELEPPPARVQPLHK